MCATLQLDVCDMAWLYVYAVLHVPFGICFSALAICVCVMALSLWLSLSSPHTLTITCTCCYDEIKGIQDLKICSHADSLILSLIFSLSSVSVSLALARSHPLTLSSALTLSLLTVGTFRN